MLASSLLILDYFDTPRSPFRRRRHLRFRLPPPLIFFHAAIISTLFLRFHAAAADFRLRRFAFFGFAASRLFSSASLISIFFFIISSPPLFSPPPAR